MGLDSRQSMSLEIIKEHFYAHVKAVNDTFDFAAEDILYAAEIMAQCLANGNCIYWCGNGGSACDSQHLAAELIGRFRKDREPYRSIALNDSVAALTSIANDYRYEDVFSRQLNGLAKSGDVLIAISTSGQSQNILNVINSAKQRGIISIALVGTNGGMAKKLADHSISVKSDKTCNIQEVHIITGHILCAIIESKLGATK